ncbi:MAG: CaiB/BaiF CoA-transferase family protein, partial [Antricoccus sp.]
RRLRGGAGQYIDVALLDSGLALTVWEAGAYFGDGEIAAANGSRHRRNAPYQAYQTADGYLTIGANNQKLWEIFCQQVIERPKLMERQEFLTGEDRIAHVESLADELTGILATRTTAEWAARLDTAGVPGGPVLTYDEALAQEQVAARHMIVTAPHKVLGDVQFLAPVAKLSDTPPSVRTAAPMLGEHTTEVLRELGYAPAQIEALLESGAIAGI